MGRLSLEVGKGQVRELSEAEITVIQNSLLFALDREILNRREAASAVICDRLITARQNNPHYDGAMVIRYRHYAAIATAVDEREGCEVWNETDPQCPASDLMLPGLRPVLNDLRQFLRSKSDVLWNECYPIHAPLSRIDY